MTDWTTPPPPDEHYVREPRRFRAVLVVLVLVVAGVMGAVLLWPESPLDDEADVDAALVTKADQPGFITWHNIEGSLPRPAEAESGRTVLTGDGLAEQCEIYRSGEDSWACEDLQSMGWVGLMRATNPLYRLLSTVLAYSDEDAAQAAYEGLVADQRQAVPEDQTESAPDLGDECVSFQFDGAVVYAIRVGPVVVEVFVADESGEVTDLAARATAEELATNQLDKIEEALG
jgi:hypothetical protein